MLVQSIVNVVEAAAANRLFQRAAGNVQDFDALFTPQNLTALEKQHNGVFAFVAFHPELDAAIAEYLRSGSLADDSGPHVLALFMLNTPAHTPIDLTAVDGSRFMSLLEPARSSTALVRDLFPDVELPQLPALVFLERLSGAAEPVAVSLDGLSKAADVRTRCARICDLAGRAYTRSLAEGAFATLFATALAGGGLTYRRGGTTSAGEWLIKALRVAHLNAGTIVSVVKLF